MKKLSTDDVVGERQRYKLVEEIGEGAILKVWSAEDLVLDKRRVAVKFLKEAENFDHFKNETDTFKKVGNYPHIVNMHDRELNGDTPFVVVDLCHATLDDVLQPIGLPFKNPVDTQRVAKKKIVELAKAVQFIHSKTDGAVVDLDPLNIMFQLHHVKEENSPTDYLEGTIKICDLNAQRGEVSYQESLLSSMSTSMARGGKSSQSMFAKPYYIAPELLVPGAEPTFAADVYTLGRLLKIMLTGEKELTPDSMPSKMGIFPTYDRVVITALKKNLDDRFSSIDSFLEALEAADQNPFKITVSFWDRLRYKGKKNALEAKTRKAEEDWSDKVYQLQCSNRRQIENEVSSKRRIEEQKENEVKEREGKEQREEEKKGLVSLLTSRPDESRVAFKKHDSNDCLVIYSVNQINDPRYEPTTISLPIGGKDTKNLEMKWLAWIDDGKKLACYTEYVRNITPEEGNRSGWRNYSSINLIDLDSLETITQELEYQLKTDDIRANADSHLIYAINDKNELIRLDLTNENKVERVVFVPVRGLKVCNQKSSCCNRFRLVHEKDRYGNELVEFDIVYQEDPELKFKIGGGNLIVWYDPVEPKKENLQSALDKIRNPENPFND